MKSRIAALRSQGAAQAYFVTSPENVRYLTGFSGTDSEVLVTDSGLFLFTDARYQEQARLDVEDGVQIVITSAAGRLSAVHDALGHTESLGLELDTLPASACSRLLDVMKPAAAVDISRQLLILRSRKTAGELACIRRAARATQEVMEVLAGHIHAGMSEFEIRAALLYEISIREMDSAFEPIVAGGPNSAIPHATTSSYRLRNGDFLTLDFGCRCCGYCADMTRTFAVGQVDAQLQTIYDIVEQAQDRAAECAQIGVRADRIDAAARDVIRRHGYAENFGHGTGHGVGLAIHELPVINASSDTVIAEGMVYTIEPGIYVEGLGGVRIEDTCIAGEGSLYTFPRDLVVL